MSAQTQAATSKSIASSIFPSGIRVDTLQLRYWRPIHGEFMTHRDFSRNAASSRAVPVASVLVRDEAFIPRFKKNKAGMQPGDYLSPVEQAEAERIWRRAAQACREAAELMSRKNGLNIAKQWPNRMLEWFGFIDVVVTSTRWSNWDALRLHADAQDEIRELAQAMHGSRAEARPKALRPGEWHLPYVREVDEEAAERAVRNRDPAIEEVVAVLSRGMTRELTPKSKVLLAMSSARTCRVSFVKHDGEPSTLADDMKRFVQLAGATPLHASPLEHQCRGLTAFDPRALQGNLIGTVQFRKLIPYECH